ncbi:MAG: HEAT repeat domain-containing protein [Steroidobacteraceae bacterium]
MRESTRQKLEDKKLEALNALDPHTDRSVQTATIQKYLADKHFRVVARAATLAGERSLRERLPDLLDAYARFLVDPIKQDPHCIAKQAIARALVNLECDNVPFFLEGIRYRQLEPAWGGADDTAIDVRCSCAMGLVSTGYFRAIQEVTTLLLDPEWRARAGAARAISCGNPREAEALLRFKVLVGDPEPDVIGECFTALLSIAKEECLPFVASYLSNNNNGVRDFAALALGESRHPQALEHLRIAWEDIRDAANFRTVLIRAAALHRSEVAFDWLISIIEHSTPAHADVAVEALSVYERNTKLVERVQAALAKRKPHRRGAIQ